MRSSGIVQRLAFVLRRRVVRLRRARGEAQQLLQVSVFALQPRVLLRQPRLLDEQLLQLRANLLRQVLRVVRRSRLSVGPKMQLLQLLRPVRRAAAHCPQRTEWRVFEATPRCRRSVLQ
jgi:hypothetical protein